MLRKLTAGELPSASVIRWAVKCGAGPYSASSDPAAPSSSTTRPPFHPESFCNDYAFGAWVIAHVEYDDKIWHVHIPVGMFSFELSPEAAEFHRRDLIFIRDSEIEGNKGNPIYAEETDEIEGESYVKVITLNT